VLDFRRNRKVPNYLGSQQQLRWLLLVGMAGIVGFLVFQSGGRLHLFAPHAEDAPWAMLEPPAQKRNDADAGPGDNKVDAGAPADRGRLFPGVRADYLSAVRDDQVAMRGFTCSPSSTRPTSANWKPLQSVGSDSCNSTSNPAPIAGGWFV
jgi:hypothetical protein